MPGKFKIEVHPEREQIELDLARGVSYRDIAARYGISLSAVLRYVEGRFRDLLAESKEARDTWSAERVTAEYEELVARAKKLIAAAEAYLEDPDNPGTYTLEPHAHEIRVVYARKGASGNMVRESKRLDQIMDQMREYEMYPVDHRMAGGDPRRYLVEGMKELGSTLERLTRTFSHALETELHIQTSPLFHAFASILLESLQDHPQIREDLADRFRSPEWQEQVGEYLSKVG